MLDEEAVKIKIEQYTRCSEDIRHYDRGLWQISSINLTVAGIIIGISFEYLSGYYRAIVLSLAFLLSLALTVILSKYVLFQLGRARFMHQIEKDFEVEILPTSTTDILDFLKKRNIEVDIPARWFKHKKANRWLIDTMLITTITLLILTLVSPFLPPFP